MGQQQDQRSVQQLDPQALGEARLVPQDLEAGQPDPVQVLAALELLSALHQQLQVQDASERGAPSQNR